MGTILVKWLIIATVFGAASCSGGVPDLPNLSDIPGASKVAFEACDTPQAVRCEGDEAQRCEGGHWYPDMDCSDVGLQCRVKEDGGKDVVRCEEKSDE